MLNNILKKILVLFAGLILLTPVSVFAGRAEGGQIDIFDVQPRTVQGGQSATFTFKVTLFSQELKDYCGAAASNLNWVINRKIGTGPVGVFGSSSKVPFSQFINGVSKDLSFMAPLYSVPTGTEWKFSAKIWCTPLGRAGFPKVISQSSEVPVTVSGGAPGGGDVTYGCVDKNGNYACSPSGLQTCSDVSACANKQCVAINKAQCGRPASDTPSGTCNNNGKCESSESNTSCPKDCPIQPGTTQTFFFELKNPLQANNLVELIDVIATWLFNIAIPITVAMIVYAGVMLLISRGDTAKVTQAKKILLYAVVGFTIILIGKGFITLIESILNLGAGP